jgi:hypothetical protein
MGIGAHRAAIARFAIMVDAPNSWKGLRMGRRSPALTTPGLSLGHHRAESVLVMDVDSR